MANMKTILWATAAGIVTVGAAVEVAGIAVPAPLDQIAELPLDMALLGVAVVGWVVV